VGVVSSSGLTMNRRFRPHFSGRAGRSRGAILVSVLWILVFLAFLAVVLRLHMSGVVESVRVTEDKAAARILADAGLARASALVLAGPEGGLGQLPDQLQDDVETATGKISVRLVNEALRIDINTGNEKLVMAALRAAGASQPLATTLLARLVEHRGDEGAQEGEENGPDTRRTARPLQSSAEIALVEGMPTQLALAMDRFVTVSSGLVGVRLDRLDEVLLHAIPGLPATVLAGIEAARLGRMPQEELAALLAGVEYHTQDKAISWRAVIDVTLPSGYGETYEALVTISPEDDVPYRVIDWRRIVAGTGNAGN
jgi:general secretion pathway protein K